jgi:hypothetical protein
MAPEDFARVRDTPLVVVVEEEEEEGGSPNVELPSL